MSKPKVTYSLGTIRVAVFENEKYDSYKISKSYKSKEGKWEYTDFLSRDDLSKLTNLLQGVLAKEIKTYTSEEGKNENQNVEEKKDDDVPF